MAGYEIKKVDANTFLICSLAETESYQSALLERINRENISSLAPIKLIAKEGRSLSYDITDCITLEHYLATAISEADYVELMYRIAELFLELATHGLPLYRVFWNKNCLFLHHRTRKLVAIYHLLDMSVTSFYPIQVLGEISQSVKLDHSEGILENYFACYYRFHKEIDLRQFLEMMKQIRTYYGNGKEESIKLSLNGLGKWGRLDVLPSIQLNQKEEPVNQKEAPINQKEAPINQKNKLDSQSDHIVEEDLEEYYETGLLRKVPESKIFYLIRQKTKERIPIVRSTFAIGKDGRYADYVISDNRAVSRRHAVISRQGERKYYIQDNDSTNHTYVDGIRLLKEDIVALHDGSKIVLGNEEFYCMEGKE